MQNLLKTLGEVLKEDKRCVIEGELNKVKIEELGLELDAELLKRLMGHGSLKKHFFTAVDDILVFDKIKFQKFINNKSLLPDSYTSFKNKIGLINKDGDFISESKEVVLSWPHKDCVLEGGQDKEDVKRDEVFFNEVLAPDEIDHLLEPKALTKFKKYDKDGEHEVNTITYDDNFIIKGNNLLALHSLERIYAGKVKLIYIDPPYNTGNDSFLYNDCFNHSSWLTFMKNRLTVAKSLLREDGFIFIQIDSNEFAYLKVLLDEIFGHDCFVNEIVWKRRGGSANPQNRLNNVSDYILWYSKKPNAQINPIFTKEDENTKKYIQERFNNKDENGRQFMKSPLQSPNPRPNLMYDYKGYRTPKNGWSISKELMERWDAEGKLWFPENKEQNINRKIYLDEYQGQPISNVWTDIKVINPMSKERTDFESGQKPESLIKRIIELSTKEGDLVLDYHAGSGTTASTALKLNRKFITIEQLDYVQEVTKNRIINTIEGDEGGVSKAVEWKGGGSFVYCELAKCNQEYVDKVTDAKDDKDLEALWYKIKEKGFISYKVSISDFDSAKSDFSELEFDDKKKFLIEVLDKNMLYVNLSEIEDEDHGISENDIKVNRYFYSLEKQQSTFEE